MCDHSAFIDFAMHLKPISLIVAEQECLPASHQKTLSEIISPTTQDSYPLRQHHLLTL
jgi:hypothetical protein